MPLLAFFLWLIIFLLCLDVDALDVNKHEDANAAADGDAIPWLSTTTKMPMPTATLAVTLAWMSMTMKMPTVALISTTLSKVSMPTSSSSLPARSSIDLSCSSLDYRFDLDLPLDEFGTVDFDYVQNLAGKHAYIPVDFFHYKIMNLPIESTRGATRGTVKEIHHPRDYRVGEAILASIDLKN
jgi:hypothetical protein